MAACGASQEIMDLVANRTLFHGGVYAGNAVVMAAAEAVLDYVMAHKEAVYAHLNKVGAQLAGGIRQLLGRLGVPHVVQDVGPIVSLFLTTEPRERLSCYRVVRKYCNFSKYVEFQLQLQRSGVYFHPNQFEPMFLSTAHSESDIACVLERIEDGARRCLAK